jgi:hypothetical protein
MSSRKSVAYEDFDDIKRRYLNFLDKKYEDLKNYELDNKDKLIGCIFVLENNCNANSLSAQQKEDMIGVLNDIIYKYINLILNIEIKYELLTRAHNLIRLINSKFSGGSNKKVKKVRKVRKI